MCIAGAEETSAKKFKRTPEMSLSHIQLTTFGHEDEDLSYEKMEEDLTCPVCLELYADPLMMPCSHSVCKACLHEIRASRHRLGQADFECPTCRDKHPMTNDQLDKLPKNLALENIVFRYQEIKSSSLVKRGQASTSFNVSAVSVDSEGVEGGDAVFEESSEDCHCGMCDEDTPNRADWFCPQCQVLYCQRCLDLYHPRRGSLGRHRVCKPSYQDSPKTGLPCPEHPKERVSIFCDTCQTPACHLCVCKGQGSHGSHVILDLETAHSQIQSTFSKVKEDLSSLMSAFAMRDKELESQLDIVKNVRELAESHMSSQYQCILSDVAATLSLAKRKFTGTLSSNLAHHTRKLHSKSMDTKDFLAKCQSLRETCESLLSYKESEHLSAIPSSSAKQGDRLSAADQSLSANVSGSSAEGSSTDGSLVIDEDDSEKSVSAQGVKEKTVVKEEESACRSKSDAAKYLDKNLSAKTDDKNSKRKPGTDQRLMTSTPISCPSSKNDGNKMDANPSQPPRRQNSVSLNTDGERDQDEKTSRVVTEERKKSVDRQNSERKLSDKHCERAKGKHDAEGRHRQVSGASSVCDERGSRQDGNFLLTQAKEIGQLLTEITALAKELQQCGSYEEEALNEMTKTAWGSVADFGRTSLSLLSELSDLGKEELDVPSVIPPVRSSMSPVSPNQKGLPRVQNRVLLTWGFNSTSFTAEPIAKSAQWTVTVARNTSHVGDIQSGYLFGVGVATRSLGSKEQVGMNADSYGIICQKGSLAFCHGGQVSPIMPLPDLPLSIRLSVLRAARGTTFCYFLQLTSATGAVQGRRVVSLCHENNGDNDSSLENAVAEGCEMFPVFTVTQRVKMQFPLTSDV